MTRVWLDDWEWGCCGDAFSVGDEVDLGIRSRRLDSILSDMLGPSLAATVDAIESHHEHEFTDRVRGRVDAVHAVMREVIERRSLRHPGHGAPPDAVMPAEGEEWPLMGRALGGGVFAGSRPSRYVIEIVNVPASATLEAARGVPLRPDEQDRSGPRASSGLQTERRTRSFAGWLVDIDE